MNQCSHCGIFGAPHGLRSGLCWECAIDLSFVPNDQAQPRGGAKKGNDEH